MGFSGCVWPLGLCWWCIIPFYNTTTIIITFQAQAFMLGQKLANFSGFYTSIIRRLAILHSLNIPLNWAWLHNSYWACITILGHNATNSISSKLSGSLAAHDSAIIQLTHLPSIVQTVEEDLRQTIWSKSSHNNDNNAFTSFSLVACLWLIIAGSYGHSLTGSSSRTAFIN